MNYSDENQQGLMSLLAASQSGLDPSIAYGVLQDIQADQQAQIAQRRERTSGLLGMLQEMAMGGMPYAGAEAMLEAAPGPMGPALQSGLQSLYPSGGEDQYLASNIEGMVRDPQTGGLVQSTPDMGVVRGPQAARYGMGEQALSPAFVPPQPEAPSPTEAIAMQEYEQDQVVQSELLALQTAASQARANEWTVDQFIQKAQQDHPEVFAMAPEEAMMIVQNAYGEAAVAQRGFEGV